MKGHIPRSACHPGGTPAGRPPPGRGGGVSRSPYCRQVQGLAINSDRPGQLRLEAEGHHVTGQALQTRVPSSSPWWRLADPTGTSRLASRGPTPLPPAAAGRAESRGLPWAHLPVLPRGSVWGPHPAPPPLPPLEEAPSVVPSPAPESGSPARRPVLTLASRGRTHGLRASAHTPRVRARGLPAPTPVPAPPGAVGLGPTLPPQLRS